MKKQQQTPKGRGASVRNACLGLTGAALQACVSAPQPVPPVRPAPPPQACPAGAVETMTGTLGLRLGEEHTFEWSDVRGRGIPVREDTPVLLFGDWDTPTGKTALPNRTRLSGRLYFGEGRVYGRFTEARTPTGETYTVCMELFDEGEVGMVIEPESKPGEVLVAPVADVRVVDRFQ
jgi:serine/threonine-protein kinase